MQRAACLLLVCTVERSGGLKMHPIRRIVVSGGTHGNEFGGVAVLQRLRHRSEEISALYPSLDVETMLTNPRAHAGNRRFVDDDLNLDLG